MDKFLKIIGVLFLSFFSILINSFVAVKLWDWFIVSLFNVPRLTLAYAYGIGLLGRVLFFYNSKNTDEIKTTAELLGSIFMSPLIALLVGYIVYQFV